MLIIFVATNKAILKDGKMEKKKPLPTDTRDGIPNRFGFKVKKPEATQHIMKKQPVFPKERYTRFTLKIFYRTIYSQDNALIYITN